MSKEKRLVRANPIKENATIGIFSPSEPIVEERKLKVAEGAKLLEKHGYKVVFAGNYLRHVGYMAGTVNDRIEDIESLLRDKKVDVLLASWGGKSCNQLLPYIDFELIKRMRKPILGFSDCCVILNAITNITGLVSFNGPNILGKMDETIYQDLAFLKSNEAALSTNLFGNLPTTDIRVLKRGIARGRLFGGNLSTFALGVVGTKYMPTFQNGIFFWESGFEPPQIVDQFLTFVRNAGVFENIRAMVIGDFIKPEKTHWKSRDPFQMLLDVTEGYEFPIVHVPSFGHAKFENPIIPIGAMCEVDTDKISFRLVEEIFQ